MLRKLLSTAIVAATCAGTAFAADITKMSWDEIVTQAKSEGEVTWYVWYFQPEFREHVKAFEEKYGIKVNVPDVASGEDAVNKVLAEAQRETGDIDVIAMGGDADKKFDIPETFLGPILPMMEQKNALTDKINGGDWSGYAIGYWGNQTGIAFDSNRVKGVDLPQTLSELETWIDENPYELGFNYEKGGSGPSFINNISRNILGIEPDSEYSSAPDLTPVFDWFNARKDKFVITGSNADSLTRLNSGEFLIVPAWEDHLASLIRKNEVGAHVRFYIPDWGMNGGGNVVAIPNNAPNKAAAILFVSWLTSADNQTAFNKTFGTAPTNKAADDSFALVPNDQRVNTRDWVGPLPIGDIIAPFIENVVQN